MNYKKAYKEIKAVIDGYYSEDSEDDGMGGDDYIETIGGIIDNAEENEELEAEKLEGLAGFFKFLNDSLANKGIRLDEILLDEYLKLKK